MRPPVLLPGLLLFLAGAASTADDPGTTAVISADRAADRAVRYVNDEVITLGDILARSQERAAVAQARNQPPPRSAAEREAFNRGTLEELTDESLLVQQAHLLEKERGIRLVDHDQVSMEVLERARELNLPMTLKDIAWQRRQVERNRLMDAVLGFMDMRTAQVSPAEMRAEYDRRANEFRRPAAVRVLQILLRPSPPTALAALGKERVDLLKAAGASADTRIKALAQERIADYVKDGITTAEQEALVKRFAGELAAEDARTDLDPEALTLAKRARTLLEREAGLRDQDGALRDLEALRTELAKAGDVQAREAAFRVHATRVSQGPNADRGGELGWVEPGSFTPVFDEQVFATPVGGLTPVFWAKEAACLVLVAERKDARLRPFAEVAGDIEEQLRRERRKSVRERTVAMLRTKASIRDLAAPVADAP